MKKFLMILILASLTSTCFAFKEPDPERWEEIGGNDKLTVWIDKETLMINTEKSQQSEHCGHTYVTTWFIQHKHDEKGHNLVKVEADLNCRTLDFRYVAQCDENGEVTESQEAPRRNPSSVLPNTVGEAMILAIEDKKKAKESFW